MTASVLFRLQGEQFTDNAGNRLISGYVYYYQAGTTTLQTTYADAANTIPNPNPLQLDGDGRLDVSVYFGSAANYKELVTSSAGATISPWPFDNIPCTPSAAGTTANGWYTGMECSFYGTVAPPGFVLAGGLTIGNASSGATGRANADTSALFTQLWNLDSTNKIYVVGAGRGSTAAADFAAGKTITLPDKRLVVDVGSDAMGASPSGRISFTPVEYAICTISNASPAVVTVTNTCAALDLVTFETTGSLPTGINAGQSYYVLGAGLSGSSFEISSDGVTPINTSSAGSGAHTVYIRHMSQTLDGSTIGKTFGVDKWGLWQQEMPPHQHSPVATPHHHQTPVLTDTLGVGAGAAALGNNAGATANAQSDDVTVAITESLVGSGWSHINVQPSYVVYKIIKL